MVVTWKRSTSVSPGCAPAADQVNGSHPQIGRVSELVWVSSVSTATPPGVSSRAVKRSASVMMTSSVTKQLEPRRRRPVEVAGMTTVCTRTSFALLLAPNSAALGAEFGANGIVAAVRMIVEVWVHGVTVALSNAPLTSRFCQVGVQPASIGMASISRASIGGGASIGWASITAASITAASMATASGVPASTSAASGDAASIAPPSTSTAASTSPGVRPDAHAAALSAPIAITTARIRAPSAWR